MSVRVLNRKFPHQDGKTSVIKRYFDGDDKPKIMVNFKCYVWLEHLNGKLCFTSWGSSLFLNYLFRSQHCVVPAFPTNVCQMCVGSWGRWLHWFLYFTSVISRMLQKLLHFFFSSYKRLGLLYLSLGKEAGSECALLICYLVE